MCESFNATLECELLVKHRFRTQRDAEAAVFDFIERGTTRIVATPHSTISHRSTSSAERKRRLEIQAKYYPRNRVNIRYAKFTGGLNFSMPT
jgi:hypothetical protein